jgi:hypothetical protein
VTVTQTKRQKNKEALRLREWPTGIRMFKPIVGGSSMFVGEEELAVEVHLPPPGFVLNDDTGELEPSEIICRSSIKEDQHWERPKRPENYDKLSKREKDLQKTNPEYFDSDLNAYRSREWHRRLYGCWFMNNGEYTYLPGPYYFYLAHWTLDVGPPKFKLADLHKSYFWQYCVEDPNCYGMVEMTKRRVGKSFFAACMLYEYISRTSNARAGIQSKTRPDAESVFNEKLIQPWRKLIDFFRPDFDRSKGDVPKSELRFFKTSGKGSKVEVEYNEGAELESWVDFKSSETHAYDSQKMKRYLCDEIFKTTEVDILKRHDVVKPCLENEDGDIIGKSIYTSTVEDMEGFLELYTKLWKESDVTKRNENGRTVSGLYRWFTPAQKIMYVDKYGIPDEERALTKIANEISGKSDDPRDAADYIRKNPRNWKEAFKTGGDNCLFNPIKLDDREVTLSFIDEKDLFERYDLIWDDEVPEGEIPKVRWIKNRNGRFRFAKDFFERFQANDVQRRGSSFLPKNNLRFTIGIDPFDHNRTKDGKFSQGAAAVYQKYDPLDSDNSEMFIAFYLGRPSSSAIFYEDMVKLCHLLSCQMLFEDNKPKIGDHFIDRGYGHFLVRDEKGHPGISGSPKTHQVMAEHLEAHIEDCCHRVIFIEMIKDWKELDLDNTTAYDLAMATGYALIAASKIKRVESKLSKLKKVSPTTFVRKFNLKKNHGTRRYTKFSKSLR